MSDAGGAVDAQWAFDRYEQVRVRLPRARFPSRSLHADSLAEVLPEFDGFVLDAFGVLNVGEQVIPGAIDRIAALRASGKRVIVLTNGASLTHRQAVAKYRSLGFDFTATEVLASRDVAARRLAEAMPRGTWAAAAAAGDDYADLPVPVLDLIADDTAFDRAHGFLLLSSARWTDGLQRRLVRALRDRPRPVVVANPDLVAPREGGLSLEPGFYAHDVLDRSDAPVIFHGKPYPAAFDDALALLRPIPPERIAMVGDTLHTDVLGGRAAGMGTVLVTRHGLFAGLDPQRFVEASGIVPDFIVGTT